jgi:cob(I)alamin adenosyltransferase
MKIYTKTGDLGETSLSGGTRVPKSDPRLEAYGTVDELNSFLGLVRSAVTDPVERDRLIRIQNRVFVVSSNLATDNPDRLRQLPFLKDEDISDLEAAMDRMSERIPELTHFILPAGNEAVAWCHVARTVCRRAERRMVALAETAPVEPRLIRFINRLSDYLFILARSTAWESGCGETHWTGDFRDHEPS